MKKNTLLLLLLFQCGAMMGQLPIETAEIFDPAGDECGIVRTWKSGMAVAYHQHDGENVFSVIDSATSTVFSVKVTTGLPENPIYTINDFRIVGDSVYCGGSVNNDAMIAYFDINELLYNTGYPGNVGFTVVKINDIDKVTKLTAYRNTLMNGVGIAAIGTAQDGYYMIECNNYGGSMTFSATSRRCFNQSQIETLTDVVVTKSFVGFVGIMDKTNRVCIRRGNKNGIFASALIDTIHQYSYLSTRMESLPVAEALDNETIAIASAYSDDWPSGIDFSVQLFLFNLANMDFFDAWHTWQPENSPVTELAYVPSSKTLLIAIINGTGDRVIYASPFSATSYWAYYMRLLNGERICSMDFRNSSYYILSTTNHWMLQRLVYPCSDTNMCIETSKVEFIHGTVCLDNPRIHMGTPTTANTYLDKIPQTVFNYTLDCIHQ